MMRLTLNRISIFALGLVTAFIMIFTGLPYERIGLTQAQTVYQVRTAIQVCGSYELNGENGFPIIAVADCEPDDSSTTPSDWEPIGLGSAICEDWVVVHTNETGNWELFRVGDLPDDVEADPNLSRGVGPRVFDLSPTRSPDHAWIAFTTNRDGNWEIYISSVRTDEQRRVTNNAFAVDRTPVWSPNGEFIVYESSRNGHWDLYLFNVTDGTERRLTTSEGNDMSAFWSPDGQNIVYINDDSGQWQIYILNIWTSEIRLLSDGVGYDHHPQVSPDGSQLAFSSFRDGNRSGIYIVNLDGTGLERISDTGGTARNHVWSPDSNLIAYTSDLDGDRDIYVYDKNTGITRLVTDNDVDDYAPTWICDSDILVFTSEITTDANIYQTGARPIDAPPIRVEDSLQLTFTTDAQQYPQNSPQDENPSEFGSFPSPEQNN